MKSPFRRIQPSWTVHLSAVIPISSISRPTEREMIRAGLISPDSSLLFIKFGKIIDMQCHWQKYRFPMNTNPSYFMYHTSPKVVTSTQNMTKSSRLGQNINGWMGLADHAHKPNSGICWRTTVPLICCGLARWFTPGVPCHETIV